LETVVFAAYRQNDNELIRIEQLIASGDLATAASKLNSLRELAPRDPRVFSVGAQLGFAANNPTAALQASDAALKLAPGWPRALFQRARALEALNRPKEALDACNQAASADPKLLGAIELAVILGRRLGEAAIPEALLRKAHASAPNNLSIWLGLGRFLSRHKKEESIAWLDKVLSADSKNLDALITLASVHFELGDTAAANDVISRAEAIDRENPLVVFQGSRIRGESNTQIPAALVRNLFDEYADRFDSHLVGVLKYRLPLVVADKIRARFPDAKLNLLDLGCGSGLLGRALGKINGYFVGVDLSEKMLQKAAEIGTYSRLHVAEIVDALTATDASEYEVIAANEVINYVANPEPFIQQSFRVLRPNGVLYFSCEQAGVDEPDVVLRADSQRYAHRDDYITALCEKHGFVGVEIEKQALRTDHEKPVYGYLVTANKPI
jgi:predicted TPR repeat methyltransferase